MIALKMLVVAAGLSLLAPTAFAVELGVIGPTYEISEPHLLQMIDRAPAETWNAAANSSAWKSKRPGAAASSL
jgi:hypothetical protein